jgi:hypothetical protein
MNKQARIDPWPCWLGITCNCLSLAITSWYSEPPTAAAATQPRTTPLPHTTIFSHPTLPCRHDHLNTSYTQIGGRADCRPSGGD